MKKTYQSWFDYEVVDFRASNAEEINEYLMDEGLDAESIVSITHALDGDKDRRLLVFYKRGVA